MADEDKSLLQDIRDRTIRLETKLDNFEEMRTDLKVVKKTADEANVRAKQNERDIADVLDKLKWVWRGIGGVIFGLVLWFIQQEFHIN